MHTLAYLSVLGEMHIDLKDAEFPGSLVSGFLVSMSKRKCWLASLDRFQTLFKSPVFWYLIFYLLFAFLAPGSTSGTSF